VPALLLDEIIAIVEDVFQVDALSMTAATVAADVNGWDSVTHTILILELERRFDIEIPLEISYQLANLGELANFISERRRRVDDGGGRP
jgi:acyl carrier protein